VKSGMKSELSSDACAAAPARRVPARTAARRIVQAGAPALALLAAIWIGLFLRLGAIPLFDVDEGAFAEATREMLARGDYVSTWLNGQPRFDKPILIYWLQAASVTVFGLDEFALRLPSSLASCAWIAAVFAFTRRCADQSTAHAAAFIAATSLGVTVIGRGAIADALLNLFLALAMFDIIHYQAASKADPSSDSRAGLRRRVYFWIGLGLLTKGPVALLVPGAASALAYGVLGRLGEWWRALRDPVGWSILLAVAAPWYLLEYSRRGDAFLAGFFMRHNVERFVAPLQGHGGSALYYAPAVLLLLLPYSGLFLATLPNLRRAWRGRMEQPIDTFLWCWFLFVFAFFSLASTKLPHYLLYGATPLFVLMARQRERLRSNWLAFVLALLFLGAVLALPFVLARAAPAMRNPYMREALGRPEAFGPAWLAGAALLLGVVLVLALWRWAPLWPRLAGTGLACACATGALLLPALAELQQGPVKEAALLARSQGWAVRSWRINVPSFSLYRGAVTPGVSGAGPAPGQVILTRSDALSALGPVQVLYRKGGVVLLRMPG
jgi:4-amino-4-deoxy-L-arabinose transferase-like glycosyltransferase